MTILAFIGGLLLGALFGVMAAQAKAATEAAAIALDALKKHQQWTEEHLAITRSLRDAILELQGRRLH